MFYIDFENEETFEMETLKAETLDELVQLCKECCIDSKHKVFDDNSFPVGYVSSDGWVEIK